MTTPSSLWQGERCRRRGAAPVWVARVVVLVAVALAGIAPAAAARSPSTVSVSGSRLIGVDGKPLRLIGVDRSGTEYSCSGLVSGGGLGYGVFQGPADAGSIRALLSWHVNAVALPLNEACWLGGVRALEPGLHGTRLPAGDRRLRQTSERCGHLRRAAVVGGGSRKPRLRLRSDQLGRDPDGRRRPLGRLLELGGIHIPRLPARAVPHL